MEKEFGVTRLLDPEGKSFNFDRIRNINVKVINSDVTSFPIQTFLDVDTPEPDEKSVITYVSQLYDVFPEPPIGN